MSRKFPSRKSWPKFLQVLALAALVAVSTLAMAADPPVLVGRIAATEGQVTVQGAGGDETGNLLNWPVKEGDRVITATLARTEFRVGPVAVRLDGDSELDIDQLDEQAMRLRLNHGSASVRIRDAAALGGFELSTSHGRILLTEPGMVRVDTERAPNTTTVSVLLGTARLEGAGTALTLRTGKRADIRGDDVSTAQALQNGFDSWALDRDRRSDASITTRYIPSDVTGYEDLDHYGSWTVNDEYGPLWSPRSIAADWAPYRDGRWAWVEPWGWTWVDNAPWGYAPFHYGRWVTVNNRWCWSPGRFDGRPVWSPALVGWVGGAGWSVSFNNRQRGPGMGWYPLTPRDRYVPHYDISPDHERRLGWRYRGNEQWRPGPDRREGITIVPREQFEQRRSVRVNNVPRATVAPNRGALPVAAPVIPGGVRDGNRIVDRNRDGRPDRVQVDRNRDGISDRTQIDRNRDGVADRLQTDRNRDGISDRTQIDRNRDGTPDRLQVNRPGAVSTSPVQTDRNRDGVVDRDRNRDGINDRTQVDRNRDGVADRPVSGRPGMSGPIQTDRNPGQNRDGVADRSRELAERLQAERQQADQQQAQRQQVERQQAERQQVERQRVERQQADQQQAQRQQFERQRVERQQVEQQQVQRQQIERQQAERQQVERQQVERQQFERNREARDRDAGARPAANDERGERRRDMTQERMQERQQQMESRREAQQAPRQSIQMAPAMAPRAEPAPRPAPQPQPQAQQDNGGRDRGGERGGGRVERSDKGQERQ